MADKVLYTARLEPDGAYNWLIVTIDDEEYEVNLGDLYDADAETWDKIGHLWIAAPDLLAACEAGVIAERAYNNYKIDPRLENLTNWRKLADQAQRMRRAAIAKARGD